jgi:hypothetical protein
MDGGIVPPEPLLLANGHSRSDDARSGVNRNPPAAPAAGATAGHAPPPGRADPATVPNGAAGPQAPPPRHHAVQTAGSQQQGRGVVATGNVRSRVTLRSTSSSPMPRTASEAMARAQLLLRFPPAADQMDEWRATIQSLIGFAKAEGSQRARPPRPSQAATMARAAGRAGGATLTVQSPPWQAARELQNQAPDDVSMASSDP